MDYRIRLPDKLSKKETDALDEIVYSGAGHHEMLSELERLHPMDKKAGTSTSVTTTTLLCCVKCGASEKEELLGAFIGAKQVQKGTKNSQIECMNVSECTARRSGNPGSTPTQTSPPQTSYKYTSGWGGGSTVTVVEKCRHKPTLVYTINGIRYHGGSEAKIDVSLLDKSWLVVSMLGYTAKDVIRSRRSGFLNALIPFISTPDIVLDWPDMKAPPVKPGFWLKLHTHAKRQKDIKNILYYCIGGHGRTGTALVGTLIELGSLSPKEALDFVRKEYCNNAVETSSQIEYLNYLYNIISPAEEPQPEPAPVAAKTAKVGVKDTKEAKNV